MLHLGDAAATGARTGSSTSIAARLAMDAERVRLELDDGPRDGSPARRRSLPARARRQPRDGETSRVDRGGRAAAARRPLRPREGAGMTGRALARVLAGGRHGRGDRRVRVEDAPAPPSPAAPSYPRLPGAGRAGRAARRRPSFARRMTHAWRRLQAGDPARRRARVHRAPQDARRRSIRPRRASASRSWPSSSSSRRPSHFTAALATNDRYVPALHGQAERAARAGRRRRRHRGAGARCSRSIRSARRCGAVSSCCASGRCSRSSRPAGRRATAGRLEDAQTTLRARAGALAVERGDSARARARRDRARRRSIRPRRTRAARSSSTRPMPSATPRSATMLEARGRLARGRGGLRRAPPSSIPKPAWKSRADALSRQGGHGRRARRVPIARGPRRR